MKENIWKKKGMIYGVNNDNPKLLTHASNPLAMHLEGDTYRIFYSGRDSQNRSSVSYVDYDLQKGEIINDYKKTIAEARDNTFYSHGITIGNSWREGNDICIGFMGWQQKEGHHWRGDIGKINLTDGKISMLLGVNEEDKVSLSYPHVMFDEGVYKMWYGSTKSWTSENGEMIHTIKYATSSDCKSWDFHGTVVPYQIGKAQAFSKPSVYKNKDGYHMWFSYRSGDGTPYRIGYAFSNDGKTWDMTQSNLATSISGWDSEMVCYPFVFKHKNKLFMLYNGNKYGINGFGLAESDIQKEEE